MLEALIEKIGEAIAPQLPMIMPFLSELLEGSLFLFFFGARHAKIFGNFYFTDGFLIVWAI